MYCSSPTDMNDFWFAESVQALTLRQALRSLVNMFRVWSHKNPSPFAVQNPFRQKDFNFPSYWNYGSKNSEDIWLAMQFPLAIPEFIVIILQHMDMLWMLWNSQRDLVAQFCPEKKRLIGFLLLVIQERRNQFYAGVDLNFIFISPPNSRSNTITRHNGQNSIYF